MTGIESRRELKATWFDVGLGTGIAASLAYAFGVFIPIPIRPEFLSFMAFGPLLCVSSVGLFVFLREHRDTVSLQISILCLVSAGLMFTAMSTMQGSIIFQARALIAGGDASEAELWRTIYRGVMSTQLGLDFAFDMFISVGTFLLAWNVALHPRFWRVFGWLGMLVSAVGLTFNAITFPENSGEVGLVDPAPFFGVWFGVFVLGFALSRSWFRGQLLEGSSSDPLDGP